MVGRSCLNFTFARNDQLSPPSLSINETTIDCQSSCTESGCYLQPQLGINWINDAGTRRSRRCWTSRFKRKLNLSWEVRMISTGEIEMQIEKRILANLQDGWTSMPRLYFFSQRPTFSSILFYQPTTIVSHRAPNLDVISNHNWVLIESTTSKKCLYPFWNHWCVVFLVFY